MSDLSDLSEFLLARIAEDAGAARRVPPFSHRDVVTELSFGPTRAHIAAWNPARVLAECEAKRRIVAYADTMTQLDRDRSRTRTSDAWVMVIALAIPYADHPDYRDEWRP